MGISQALPFARHIQVSKNTAVSVSDEGPTLMGKDTENTKQNVLYWGGPH